MVSSINRSTCYNIIEYYTSIAELTIARERLIAVGDLAVALAYKDRYYAGIGG